MGATRLMVLLAGISKLVKLGKQCRAQRVGVDLFGWLHLVDSWYEQQQATAIQTEKQQLQQQYLSPPVLISQPDRQPVAP
jgi:hypothetical protein